MAKAELTRVVPFSKDAFFDTIVKYEDYPQFVTGCKKIEVERKAPGQSRVTYHVNLMKDLWYKLDHVEDREKGVVTWKLVDSDLLKGNAGTWTLKDLGNGQCEVKYEIEIDFKIWVPGPILNTLVKGSLPSMLSDYEKQTKKRIGG